MPTYLAGRRLGRSPGTGFAAALLLLLSMGLLVLATSYRAIVLRNHSDAAHVQVGADWKRRAPRRPTRRSRRSRRCRRDTMAVVRTDPSFSTGSFSLPPTALGIDPSASRRPAGGARTSPPHSLDDILAGLDTEPIGVPVPDGATELTMTVDVPRPYVDGLRVQATSVARRAARSRRASTPLARAPTTVALDARRTPERLLSITFDADTGHRAARRDRRS